MRCVKLPSFLAQQTHQCQIHRSKEPPHLGPCHTAVKGSNTEEQICHSPKVKMRASSQLFLHLAQWGGSFPSYNLPQPSSWIALHTLAEVENLLCGYQRREQFSYLESVEVCWFEVIR